jgi:hypothetical protein
MLQWGEYNERTLGGCAALISKDYPLAIYVHSASYSLNLVLSDAFKVDVTRNTIGTMKGMVTFIRASEKCMDTLKEQITKVELGSGRTRLVKLNETRWVERLASYKSRQLTPHHYTSHHFTYLHSPPLEFPCM